MLATTRVAILDYGAGNLYSISKAIEQFKVKVAITSDSKIIRASEGFVLPGVGAFRDALPTVRRVSDAITHLIEEGRPILGICLGMQLFFAESTEKGIHKGLGILPGRVDSLPNSVKVPHMGWNTLFDVVSDPLTEGVKDGDYVYFVHSYAPTAENEKVILAKAKHGRIFPAIVRKGPVWGTQFHPEKSGVVGKKILTNFINLI
ncbi:MAG: imidazole glycerol phosphate synthase subunit HisH [Candidatus Ranarchaeia archaeon]